MMNNRRIKPWTGLLVFMLILTACSPAVPTENYSTTSTFILTKSPTITATPEPTATITPTPVDLIGASTSDLRLTKVHFWYPWPGDVDVVMKKLISKFNGTNTWGIWVDGSLFGNYNDLFDAVNQSQGTDQFPQLTVAFPEQAQIWLNQMGSIVDLAPYVTDPEVGYSPQDIVDFPQAFWNQDVDGKVRLGIPAMRSGQVIYYNETWAKELGFTHPPKTLDEFQQQACKAAQVNLYLKQEGKPGTGGWIVDASSRTMLSWLLSNGSTIDLEGTDIKFNTPEIQQTFEYLRVLYDQGCAWVSRNPEPYEYFSNRQALFYSGDVIDLPQQLAADGRVKNNDQWTVIPFPTSQKQPVMLVYGPSFVVLKTSSREQLAAWLFARWLSEPAQQEVLSEASGMLPVRISAFNGMQTYRDQHPQWSSAVQLIPDAIVEPQSTNWLVAEKILQDAAHQLFQPETKPEQIPSILEQMDEMYGEVTSVNK